MAIAKTSTRICPDLVPVHTYGQHSSKVETSGTRTWTFENEKLRDQFIKAVDKGAYTRKWAKNKTRKH